MITLLTDLGGHLTLTRAVARQPSSARKHLTTSLHLKLILSVAVIGAWAAFGGISALPTALQFIMIGALLCFSFVEWLCTYLRGFGLVIHESILLAIDCLIAFAAGAAALMAGASPVGLAISQLLAHAIALVVAVVWVRRRVPTTLTRGTMERFVSFFKSAAPTGVAIFVLLASWRLGILALMTGHGASGQEAVGFYAVAHRLLEVVRFLPLAAAAALFPSFARKRAQVSPGQILVFLMPVTIATSALFTIPAVSTFTVCILFTDSFAAADRILTVLMWAFPFLTLNAILAHWLIAREHERLNVLLSFTHIGAHAIALYCFVPVRGAEGAAYAMVVAEVAQTLATGLVLAFLRKKNQP